MWVEDEIVSIGGHEVQVARGERVVVDKRGSVHVQSETGPPAGWKGLVKRTLARKSVEPTYEDIESEDAETESVTAGSKNNRPARTRRRSRGTMVVAAGSQDDESWWSFLR